jgi:hypothetical protein
MTIDPQKLDPRIGQLSRLLGYLPAIFQEPTVPASPLPVGRLLMAFESLLLGLSKNRPEEWADLQQQPGFEEILGGALQQGTAEQLLDGVQRYFDPGAGYSSDSRKIADYNRAPSEFLAWLGGWVALALRDDWTDDQTAVHCQGGSTLPVARHQSRCHAVRFRPSLAVRRCKSPNRARNFN